MHESWKRSLHNCKLIKHILTTHQAIYKLLQQIHKTLPVLYAKHSAQGNNYCITRGTHSLITSGDAGGLVEVLEDRLVAALEVVDVVRLLRADSVAHFALSLGGRGATGGGAGFFICISCEPIYFHIFYFVFSKAGFGSACRVSEVGDKETLV